MAKKLILSGSVFLGTAYAIALASTTDELHHQALALAGELESGGTRLVTTWAVLLEIGNALSKRRSAELFFSEKNYSAVRHGLQ